MDAFFASVEQRDRPELRGLPVVVGGNHGRGVIAAASYEARKYGVKSAMPAKTALRKCPSLIFIPSNFNKYKAVSKDIKTIFKRYTSSIEPLSLDEAYLDVTKCPYANNSATLIAQAIKNDIANELGLVASAGVSYTKFLAKVASDMDKPDGLFVISPSEGPAFIQQLPVNKFFGVGKVLQEKLESKGIYFGRDLLPYSKTDLQLMFGKMGKQLHAVVHNLDDRPVVSDRIRKSIGAENTFSQDVEDALEKKEKLNEVFEVFWNRYSTAQLKGRTLTLKIKKSNFEQHTRSFSLKDHFFTEKEETRRTGLELIEPFLSNDYKLRLIGLTVSNFDTVVPSSQLANGQIKLPF